MNWAPPQARVGLCAPCAQGKACSCSTPCNCKKPCGGGDKPVTVAGVAVGGWAVRAAVGLFEGERAIPWTKVAEFDAMARELNTDVSKWTSADTSGGPNEVPKSLPFKLKWDSWYFGWTVWFATNAETGWTDLSVIGIKVLTGSKLLEYDVKRAEYDELLREAQTLGVPTKAVEAPKGSPVEKLIEEAAKGGASALDFGATLAKYGGTFLLIAGVGYAGILLLPTFSAAIARRVG